MAEKLTIFDDDSLREIAERIRELQAMHKNVREFMAAIRREPYGHVVRTVKTSTRLPDFLEYPETGAVFPFQFESWDFDEEPGAVGIANADEWPTKKPIGQVYGGLWVPEGTRLIAVKVPSATKGRQWWGFVLPEPLVRFELTANLCAATGEPSSATAKLLDKDLAEIDGSPEIEVFDAVGWWHGLTGYQGWAVWKNDASRYEIIFLEALARFIQFELLEDMTSDCSVEGYGHEPRDATVVHYWGAAPNGKNPADGQGVVQVYDRAELFPLALETARGFAIYDEQHATELDGADVCRGRYVVVQCDQMNLYGTAQAVDDYCCDVEIWEIESYLEGTAAPFSQRPDPEPTLARNIFGLAVQAGDELGVMFSHLYCDWIVYQVLHKCIDVVTAFRLYDPGAGQCKHLQLGTKGVAVPMCSDAVTWPAGAEGAGQQSISLSSVDVVNDVTFTGLDSDTGAFNSGECSLNKSVRRVCVLDDSAGASDPRVSEILQFTEVDVISDVYDTGSALGQTVQLIYVPCVGTSANEGIVATTDCSTGTNVIGSV